MSQSYQSNFMKQRPTRYFAFFLIIIGISRYIPLDYPELFNFSPVLAIFLISGAFFKGHFSWIIPIFAVLATDFMLSKSYGSHLLEPFMFGTVLSYSLIFLLGKYLGNTLNLLKFATLGVASAILFHLITCSMSWWINPVYDKSIYGLIKAIVWGEPGYAPSYLFLRNSVLSSLFFSVIFAWLAKKAGSYNIHIRRKAELHT